MRVFNARGQLLVETALVIPVFAFSVWTLAQLAYFCLNRVECQRMAQIAADQVTETNYQRNGNYTWFHTKFGAMGLLPSIRRRLVPIPEQKNFKGIRTVDTGGRLVEVVVANRQMPGHFMGRSYGVLQPRAAAPVWLEPAIEEEK